MKKFLTDLLSYLQLKEQGAVQQYGDDNNHAVVNSVRRYIRATERELGKFNVLKAPLTVDELRVNTNDGQEYLTVLVSVPFGQVACCAQREGEIDGLNELVDTFIGHSLCDVRYKPIAVDGDNVIIEVRGDASDALDMESEIVQ